MSIIRKSLQPASATSFTPSKLYDNTTLYGNILFIQYIPKNTIRSRWYLVQVMPINEYPANKISITIGLYRVSFLARHTDNKHLPHDTARWWSELHHVTVQNKDLLVFDKRILAPPNRTPDESTHQLWVHIIPLYIQTVIYWVLLHLNLVQILYGLTNLLHEKYGIHYYNYIRRYIFFSIFIFISYK